MKDILAAIGASACVAAVAMLVIGYVLHCYAEWFPSGLPF